MAVNPPPNALPGVWNLAQINLGKCLAASQELVRHCIEQRVMAVMVQEPYLSRRVVQGVPILRVGGVVNGVRVIAGGDSPRAAIFVFDPAVDALEVGSKTNRDTATAVLEFAGERILISSVYCWNGRGAPPMRDSIETLMAAYRERNGGMFLVGADANAKNHLWYSGRSDPRGQELELVTTAEGLWVMNVDGQPKTFRGHREGRESNIDVTLASPELMNREYTWRVGDEVAHADHRLVRIMIEAEWGAPRSSSGRFRTSEVDWDIYRLVLEDEWRSRREVERNERELPERVLRLEEILSSACERACGRTKPKTAKMSAWWTRELTDLNRKVNRERKKFQRERNEERKREKKREFVRVFGEYKDKLREERKKGWREFVSTVGRSDPWSLVYKVQCEKLKVEQALSTVQAAGGETRTVRETLEALCGKMFPADDHANESEAHQRLREAASLPSEGQEELEVTEALLYVCLREFKNGKAPGIDGLEVRALKESWEVISEEISWIMRECLRTGTFPERWKTGKLVILRKLNKPPGEIGSYRPITLLPVVGKLLEKVVARKMRHWMREAGIMDEDQFGFVPGRGTSDALGELKARVTGSAAKYVAGVFVDISGAFDNAWPPLLLEVLRRNRCPSNLYALIDDYLKGRSVIAETRAERMRWYIEKGCPQGSVLGPLIWNLILHDWLRRNRGEGISVIAYADDVIILVEGENKRELEERGNAAVADLSGWTSLAKLTISVEKTKGVMLKGAVQPGVGCIRHRIDWSPEITLNTRAVDFETVFKYLGVNIDQSWLFGKQVCEATGKASQVMQKMKRVNAPGWGVGWRVMMAIYVGVFLPVITYGAAAWGHRAEQTHVKRRLRAAQRTAIAAASGAYVTVSWAALVAISGVLPIERVLRVRSQIDLRRHELMRRDLSREDKRKELREYEKGLNDREWSEWKAEFARDPVDPKLGRTKNRRVRRKIPDLVEWAKGRKRRIVDQYIVGYMTGHIGVREYLYDLGHAASDECECGWVESVDHVMWDCDFYRRERRDILRQIGNRDRENLTDDVVYGAIRIGMRTIMKRRKERLREVEAQRVAAGLPQPQHLVRGGAAPTQGQG